MPHRVAFVPVSSQNNNVQVFKKMPNQLLHKLIPRLAAGTGICEMTAQGSMWG